MELVKVSSDFFDLCNQNGANKNNQLLHNEAGRPCVLIVKLSYKNQIMDFVVPMKSNITHNTDKKLFFALPPNKRTRTGNFHGVYYIKLFPVSKKYISPYLYSNDKYLVMVKGKIDKNEQTIIKACQEYLDEYALGNRNRFTPDIDEIIRVINQDLD